MLFIIYINDITNTSDVLDLTLFADDTTILYSHKNIASQINFINRELLEVSNWFKANNLSVNTSKINFMVLGTPQKTKYSHNVADTNEESDVPNTSVILDGTELSRVKTTKFPGLTIDENVTWKYHIDNITKMISCNIGVMNKIKQFVPERILYSLYCSLILPYINYGIYVWGSTCKTYIDKILKLQKWALRTISNSHFRTHTDPLFAKYNVLNVYDMYKLETGVFMYKYSKGSTITLDIKIIFIKQEMLEPFQITQSELMGQYFGIHWTTTFNSIKHFKNQYKTILMCLYN